MIRTARIIIVVVLFAFGSAKPSSAEQVGLIPIPILENVRVEAGVTFDLNTGLYDYSYAISNPDSNTGKIVIVGVDISQPSKRLKLSSEGLTIPLGGTITFDEFIHHFEKLNYQQMVPCGQNVPYGWTGGFDISGYANFGASNKDSMIHPGVSKGGFEIISRGLPAIRKVMILPDWVYMVEDLEAVTPEEEKRANEVSEEIRFYTKTVGPTAPPINVHGNFLPNALLMDIGNYVYEARNLGWITDAALYDKLFAKYLEAKQAIDSDFPYQVVAVMDEFITLLNGSTDAQRTNEAYGLLYYNAKYMRDNF